MTVRPVKLSDHEEWLSLRMALWPECPADQQLAEMLSYGDVGGSQPESGTFPVSLKPRCDRPWGGARQAPSDTLKAFS